MKDSWEEILSLLRRWRWRELLYMPTDNATLQFLRYIIVGGCAFVADFCTVWLVKELGFHYLVAGVFGFVVGVIVNYILSKTLAFSGKKANMSAQAEFALFIIISLIGLGLTELLMWAFTDGLGFYYLLSKAVAAVIVLLWNFFAKKLMYRKK